MTTLTLEEILRANLAHETNGKGRPVGEYRLRVEELADGVLGLHVHAEGFPNEEFAFGVTGNLLNTQEELAHEIVARAAERRTERERVDREHAAAVAAQAEERKRLDEEEHAAAEEKRLADYPKPPAEARA